ncbi:MAG: Fic family protein [Candidatus Thiodiazotropha endolucinida]|uniref:Adenosine monophosphate-protein transferase SoFic n=1 Tax=Candidatus Thiodiazotropha endolucinida TaxID=1655433 RepID=A0A7Z1AG64_9GAMM|nr:Fic family protein [Candidatus Thiodiazotropha endolucinida]ODJ87759.1 adenosine monophosphate-protein transferase SoFic [Candidatus Thiodiazotropha endolucinida]
MAKPSEKLAESLEALHELQAQGTVAIRSADLSRTHRERLLRNGFLQEVIKGWYVPTRPDETAGESTAWYAAFWPFCAAYLQHLKGNDWCLSPEQSLSIHAENWTVPRQLLVRAIKARNNITALPHNTSLLDIRATLPDSKDIVEKNGLRLFSLPAALIACAPGYFQQNPTDMRAALSMVRDASEVLDRLLEGGHSTIAGRLAGAFRNIGRERIADDITNTMRTAGYDVRENDPFETQIPVILPAREQSPYVNRIRLMWQEMREKIIERFPKAPGQPKDIKAYLKHVEDVYVSDAYHSLSIEGYRVSPELIERVRSGNWNPDEDENDREHRNALAARGYWQAYQAVRESVGKVLQGNNPGTVVDDDHRIWYREMFAPGVTAGLLRAADLAGYRNGPVYIRRSMHVPPSCEAVRDAMPAFFDLLRDETDPSVRVVLGHFIFVYIHPYMDGNGRIGRFLMNVMLASGGYPWTVVPLQRRDAYMDALEQASVNHNIVPFTDFLSRLVKDGLKGKAAPKFPI